MTHLRLDDVVSLDDDFGNHWDNGVVTALRPDVVYVRWPDQVIGIFPRRFEHRLKKAV